MRRNLHLLVLIALAAGLSACYQRAENLPRVVDPDRRPAIDLGIVPTRTPRDEVLRYGALAAQLSESTGHRIIVRPAATNAILRDRLRDGRVDLAVMGPVAYARAREAIGVEALAHELVLGEATYRAVVVVREESGLETMADLADRVLALVDPESTTGHLLPLEGMRDAGLDPETIRAIRYGERQEEVIRAVQMREVDAGAVREETARRHEGRGLRILWRSEPLPGPVIVARSGLDPDLRAALRAALLAGSSDAPAAIRPLPAEDVPTYAPVPDAAMDLVRSCMTRIYGPDALVADLRLESATPR